MTKKTRHPISDADKVICQNLNRLRKKYSLSMQEMANLLGYSFQQMQKVCGGKNRLKMSDSYKLAELWQIDMQEFIKPI